MTLYYFAYNKRVSVDAGVEKTETATNLLRELFPDRAFKLKQVIIAVDPDKDVEGRIVVARNQSAMPYPSESPEAKAGYIAQAAFGTGQHITRNIIFKEDVEFDQNDSLNIIYNVRNAGTETEVVDTYITLIVEA